MSISSFFGAVHDTNKNSNIMGKNFVFILQNYKEIHFDVKFLQKKAPIYKKNCTFAFFY